MDVGRCLAEHDIALVPAAAVGNQPFVLLYGFRLNQAGCNAHIPRMPGANQGPRGDEGDHQQQLRVSASRPEA